MLTGYAQRSAPFSEGMALHLVGEINHRVLNQYADAISLISTSASHCEATTVPALTLAVERLRDQAEAHRALLAPFVDGTIDLGLYLEHLCASLSRAMLAERGISLTVAAEEIWLDGDRSWRVGLIVSELIRDAVRNGPPASGSTIWVLIGGTKDEICCVVCDSGISDHMPVGGRTRILLQTLARELGGAIEWRLTSTGRMTGIEFPRMVAGAPSMEYEVLGGSVLS